MAVTKSRHDPWQLFGLSTDVKWTDAEMPDGSRFTETDTGRQFIYNGSEWKGYNFPIGAQIGSDTTFAMTAGKTAGDVVSATFTMPGGGTFETIAISSNNPTTCDLTCNLYAQETLGTAAQSCLIGALSLTKSASQYNQVTGAFLATNLLMQISPDAAIGTSGAVTVKLRSVRGSF